MQGKKVTEKDLKGFIIKLKNGGYVLHTPEKRKSITSLKILKQIDIESHNEEYLEEIKKRVEIYGEDGFNDFGFDKNGIHRNGTRYDDNLVDALGWKKILTHDRKGNITHYTSKYNMFTGTEHDLEGRYKSGFDVNGIDREGFNEDGYDKDGYGRDGFNAEGIHRDTQTKYGPDGFTIDGMDEEGFNREGINKKGKTKEIVEEQKDQQRKNFLGLRELAEGYASGEISIEDYLRNHKISLDDLIAFAKKQNMGRDVIVGLHGKRKEYNQNKKRFNKAMYFRDKTTINGIEVTEEMVDKVIEHLKANDRLLTDKIVNDHIRAYVKGELKLDGDGEQAKEASGEPTINEFGEIIRPDNNREFNEQEVGKATIDAPTEAKQNVSKTKQETLKEKESKTNENEGESIDDN